MDKETRLEEKVRRLMVSTNGYPSYALLPLEILVKHADFVFMCKVVALAIAEEREACIECAERWLEGSSVLDVRGYITGERF